MERNSVCTKKGWTPRAIFFDIDGTLVPFETHRIAQSTKDAVKRARRAGARVFVATGRPRPFIDNLEDLEVDGIMCTNGASCLDADGKCYHLNAIPADDIERLIERQRSHPIPVILSDNERIFMADPEAREDEVRHIMTMLDITYPQIRPIEEARGMNIVQAVAFFRPDEEEFMMNHIFLGCEAKRWHSAFADVVARGTHKAAGIDVVCKHYGIALTDTMAFGDGGNDIEMLKHVAVGVAMGGACDEVKAAADIVTTHANDDGIANILNQYFD